MTSFDAGDIIWVRFPHVETRRITRRPALVISHALLGPDQRLLWALMITNAARPSWPGDIDIDDFAALGLTHPSKIRTAKIATLDAREAEQLGNIGEAMIARVKATISNWLDTSHG